MHKFKPQLLLSAMVATGLMTSAQVIAQESEEDVEVIQVTGIRSSLAKSQALKQDNDSIVEAISAEDIGKLPDVSIADSLSRLTGITTQRLNGRSQMISVRGLSPDFTTATLNGRQMVSTSDNRAVEFDMFPSELLTNVVVYKTPDAAVTAQAMGGTIDMQTISPLAHGESAFVVSGNYDWNQDDQLVNEVDDNGRRMSASYIDQFMDGTLGVAFGYSKMLNTVQNQRYEAWGFDDVTLEHGPNEGETVRKLNGAKSYLEATELDRDTFMAVVEYAPNDKFTAKFDAFYSEYKESTFTRGFETPFNMGDGQENLGDYVIEDGLMISADYHNQNALQRNDAAIREADTLALGLNLDFQLNDDWNLNVDLSYSKADRKDMITETFQGHRNAQTWSMQNTGKGFMLGNNQDWTDRDMIYSGSPQGWGADRVDGGQAGFYKEPQSEDEMKSIRVIATRDLDSDHFRSVEFGINHDDRSKYRTTQPELFLSHSECIGMENPLDCRVALPDGLNTYNASIYHRGIGGMTGFNPFDLFNHPDYYLLTPDDSPGVIPRTWWVDEKITTAFTKLNIDAEIADIPIRGNMGMQIVRTEQSSDSFAASIIDDETGETEISDVHGGKTFTEFLPSINLTANVADGQFVRFGAARVMARPRMDDLSVGFTYDWSDQPLPGGDPDSGHWVGNGGNPELDPWMANQVDIAYDYYFDNGLGYFSAAYFYKDLRSYVINEGVPYDFDDIINGGGIDNPHDTTEGIINRPRNGNGGSIDGIELTLQLAGEMFHDSLEGWGTTMSASFTDSNITPNEDNPSEPLPGLSKNVYTATLYYENDNFGARVSARHRSKFLGDVANFASDRIYRYIDSETLVDAQISYNFTEGDLEGLTLILQGTNLTDEEFKSYNLNDPREIIDFQQYGRSFSAGFIYKF